MPDPEFTTLNHSYEAYGMVLDFLSRTTPFARFELGELSAAIRLQLNQKQHIAAIAGNSLVGYAGWLPTSVASAKMWLADRGPLVPALDGSADAAALTVIAARIPGLARKLAHGVRDKNPGRRIYFKRATPDKPARKSSVLSRGAATVPLPQQD